MCALRANFSSMVPTESGSSSDGGLCASSVARASINLLSLSRDKTWVADTCLFDKDIFPPPLRRLPTVLHEVAAVLQWNCKLETSDHDQLSLGVASLIIAKMQTGG